MAEPGRLGPAAGSEGTADEFRDVIRSRSAIESSVVQERATDGGLVALHQNLLSFQHLGAGLIGAVQPGCNLRLLLLRILNMTLQKNKGEIVQMVLQQWLSAELAQFSKEEYGAVI
ncbi:hypothetical protein DUI87_15728 [Hirundo rustica rustica]|uniref:Uncharacterized protein n=1 Tax=Hirundo rustica rustica TaxID=333673 RepID=A0A3M0KGP6_HIRRU|nr:hypothetical protein DUI87_15728 [Hirundo rustica rustica]